MARPLHIEYPGALYHLMARGNQGRAIFRDDRDRLRFLETLGGSLRQDRLAHSRHSGAVKREPGERAAEQLLQAGLAKPGLTAEGLKRGRKVTAEKAALSRWLRERTTVSLRWVSGRLGMGHDSNAGRGPRRLSAGDARKMKQTQSTLETLAGAER